MQMKLTVVFLALLIAAHAIDASGVRVPTPIPPSEVNANEQKIARRFAPLADALTSCISLLKTSKHWQELPHSPLAMAKSYFMAITQLVDQLLETIDTIVPHMDYKMRQALNIDRFLFEIARMAYILVQGIYYAPKHILAHKGDAPSESASKQLHAYFYYVTHIACISFGSVNVIWDTTVALSGRSPFRLGEVKRIKQMAKLYNAYVDEDDDFEPSVVHYLACAGAYGKAFSTEGPHPDTGRYASALADEDTGDDELEKIAMLREACKRMGGSAKSQKRRFHSAQKAMFIEENLRDMFGERLGDE